MELPTIDQDNIPQSLLKPSILILPPGGVKGFYEIGALIYLEEIKALTNLTKVVGVSVGSIIGLLYVIGYKPPEIFEIALSTDLLYDFRNVNLKDIPKNLGILSPDVIRTRLTEKVIAKFGFVPNMQQLYTATGIEFVTITTNTTSGPEAMSYRNEPSLSCIEAALMSANVPLLFYIYKYKNSVYVDGACSNPLPIDIYDDGTVDILALDITVSKVDKDISPYIYLYGVIDSMIGQIKKRILERKTDRCQVLELASDVNDIMGTSLTREDKWKMTILGYTKAREFVERKSTNGSRIVMGENDNTETDIFRELP